MIGLVTLSVVCGLWAGFLALAEESPNVSRLAGAPSDQPDVGDQYRSMLVSRLALLLASAVAASYATEWWTRPPLQSAGALLLTGGFLYMISEALPRSVAALAPDVASSSAAAAARTVGVFSWLLLPARWTERIVTGILPRVRPTGEADTSAQRDMLLGLFSLQDTTVSEIMTPRMDVDALESNADWNGVIEHVRRSEHARIPVYTETRDRIDGILYAKDLVAAVAGDMDRPARWQDLIRPAEFVPESKSLSDQLRDFQRGPAHLAVVVDEYGGTSGIVTLEDTLEEIVGEIHDEYDATERPAVEREGDDKFWVEGSLSIDELEALLGISIEAEDFSTVGGLVYSELGRVPDPGEEFRYGPFKVIVEQMIRRRIRRVYFERTDEPTVPDDGEAT